MASKKYIVADYMHTPVISVPETATLRQALEKMITNHTNGLVVVSDHNQVAGILSSMDIIAHITPDYLEEDKHLASFEAGDQFEKLTMDCAEHPVSTFMTRKVHTIKTTHSLMEAMALQSEHKIRQLPVVDESGKLVGYLNRTDIKRAMGEILGYFNHTQ